MGGQVEPGGGGILPPAALLASQLSARSVVLPKPATLTILVQPALLSGLLQDLHTGGGRVTAGE